MPFAPLHCLLLQRKTQVPLMNRVCAIPYTLDRLKAPVFYPHLFEVACQASRYRWDCETVKDCIGLRGCFTESNCKMWVKDSHLWRGVSDCPTSISRSAGITCDSTGMIMLAREGRLGYTARHDGVVLMKCVPSTIVANSKH